MHSILIPHRNRQKNLAVCINALNNAAANSPEPVEAIVYDQSEQFSRVNLKEIHLKLNWIDKPQSANIPFHKSKALNEAIGIAKGDLITILDCDMVAQPHWLKAISEYFSSPANRKKKLGHRVRLLDSGTSRYFHISPNYVERYAKMQHKNPFAAESYNGITTGNAIYTMTADLLRSTNGYRQEYSGYGLEDWEFNLRAQKIGIFTEMLTTADLYHLHHIDREGWGLVDTEYMNQMHFKDHQAEGFPLPPRPECWDYKPPGPCCCFRSTGEGFELHPLELE